MYGGHDIPPPIEIGLTDRQKSGDEGHRPLSSDSPSLAALSSILTIHSNHYFIIVMLREPAHHSFYGYEVGWHPEAILKQVHMEAYNGMIPKNIVYCKVANRSMFLYEGEMWCLFTAK